MNIPQTPPKPNMVQIGFKYYQNNDVKGLLEQLAKDTKVIELPYPDHVYDDKTITNQLYHQEINHMLDLLKSKEFEKGPHIDKYIEWLDKILKALPIPVLSIDALTIK